MAMTAGIGVKMDMVLHIQITGIKSTGVIQLGGIQKIPTLIHLLREGLMAKIGGGTVINKLPGKRKDIGTRVNGFLWM